MSRVREITDAELRHAVALPTRTFTLLDVREDHEWEAGHIPSARHLGRGILERDIEALLPAQDAEIVLYCGGGYRSALAADSIARMGYRNVRSLRGGFRGWKSALHPIEVSAKSPVQLPHVPRHIVVATDLTEGSTEALQTAVALADLAEASLHIVHAIEPLTSSSPLDAVALEGMPFDWAERYNAARHDAAHAQLLRVAQQQQQQRPRVRIATQAVFGLVPDAILAFLAAHPADLLVVSSHGRRGLAHFLLGSVAERLMRSAPCPVLLVRPTAPGA